MCYFSKLEHIAHHKTKNQTQSKQLPWTHTHTQSESRGLGKLEEVRFQRWFKRHESVYDLIQKFDVIGDTDICFFIYSLTLWQWQLVSYTFALPLWHQGLQLPQQTQEKMLLITSSCKAVWTGMLHLPGHISKMHCILLCKKDRSNNKQKEIVQTMQKISYNYMPQSP